MPDVNAVISSLNVDSEKFQLINQGSIDKYLGLMITDINSGTWFVVLLNSCPLTSTQPKGAILRLESLCLIAILTGYLVNTLGYILVQLACSVISATVFDLKFKWQCIKQLDSW
jgi:hypothetical protein